MTCSRLLDTWIIWLQGALCEMCPNTEFFLVRIQSECGKIRTRKNAVFGHFSRSGEYPHYTSVFQFEVESAYFHHPLFIFYLTFTFFKHTKNFSATIKACTIYNKFTTLLVVYYRKQLLQRECEKLSIEIIDFICGKKCNLTGAWYLPLAKIKTPSCGSGPSEREKNLGLNLNLQAKNGSSYFSWK